MCYICYQTPNIWNNNAIPMYAAVLQQNNNFKKSLKFIN